ncbi:MAG: Dabb family protein [Chloroflexi bacterium]|nr:Dabb family protein [Chloroflexota bacterium]
MPSITGAGVIHIAHFTLRPELTEEQKEAYFRTAQAFDTVPGILGVDQGPNIEENSPYMYTRIIYYADAAAREALHRHPLHIRFGEKYSQPMTERRISYTIQLLNKNQPGA